MVVEARPSHGDDQTRPSTTSLFRRPVVALAILGALAVLAVVFVLTTVDPWFPNVGLFFGSADLHVYEEGGNRVRENLPLYSTPILLGHLYTYTPFSAMLFVPIAVLPEAHMDKLWMAMNLGLLVVCVLLCWKIVGRRITPEVVLVSTFLALICIFLEPIRTTLFYGQVNIGLMLLVLWDLSRPEGSRWRGVGVGLAAAIKLTPAFFIAFYVVVRQWRAAAVATLVIAASIGLGFVLLPSDSREYWTHSVFQTHRIADPMHAANQSLRGMLNHLAGHPVSDGPWLLLAVPAALVALVVSALLYRRGETLFAVSLCGLTSAAVSPFSWSHHWVWFVPLLVYFFDRALRSSWWWLVPAVVVYAAAGSWPWQWSADFTVIGLFHYPPDWDINWFMKNIFLFVYAGIVVIGIAVVAAGFVTERRNPTPSPQHRSPDPADDRTGARTPPNADDQAEAHPAPQPQ